MQYLFLTKEIKNDRRRGRNDQNKKKGRKYEEKWQKMKTEKRKNTRTRLFKFIYEKIRWIYNAEIISYDNWHSMLQQLIK